MGSWTGAKASGEHLELSVVFRLSLESKDEPGYLFKTSFINPTGDS